MSTERQKMLAGEMYDPLDLELVAARARARDLCQDLNATREADQAGRRRILRELFGKGGDTVWMQPPFYCDYGTNIELGERVFFNFNCIVLDVCRVRIGDFTLFFAGMFPESVNHYRLRRQRLETRAVAVHERERVAVNAQRLHAIGLYVSEEGRERHARSGLAE